MIYSHFSKEKYIFFQQLLIHKTASLNEIIHLPKPSCTLPTLVYTCVHSSICSARNNRYPYIGTYTHSHTQNATHTLIRLRQSLQLNWAFLKLWSVPFGPTLTPRLRSIQMEVQGTQRHQFVKGCFSLSPVLFFYLPIIKFCFSNSLTTHPEIPTYRFENIEILFLQWAPWKEKKNKPPDGKYKPSAGVMHKIPNTFFFSLK